MAYDAESYFDHHCAKLDGELHKTGSTMDAIESQGGFLDMMEMTELFSKVTRRNDITYGIVAGMHFISLTEIKKQFEKHDEDVTEHGNIDTLEAIEAILNERESVKFSISVKAILGEDCISCILYFDKNKGKNRPLEDSDKMSLIKEVGRAIINDRDLEMRFPEEIKVVKDEMAAIQKKKWIAHFN